MAFNKLNDAQLERLYILSEELGEAQQAIGKILRHGYDNKSPDDQLTNRENLEYELGDIKAVTHLLTNKSELRSSKISVYMLRKLSKFEAGNWLHHQNED
jgi:NTP pyrophosphatase (non-canonical NTP hydrolase)